MSAIPDPPRHGYNVPLGPKLALFLTVALKLCTSSVHQLSPPGQPADAILCTRFLSLCGLYSFYQSKGCQYTSEEL